MLGKISFLIFASVLTFWNFSAASGNTIPLKCKLSEDIVVNDECLRKNIEKGFRSFASNPKKAEELGLPVLEPLFVKTMHIQQQGNRAVSIDMKFKDNLMKGLGNFKILQASANLEKFGSKMMQMHIKMATPVLTMTGPYNISGSVLFLPISGTGESKLAFENLINSIDIYGSLVKKNDESFLDVKKFQYSLSAKKMILNLPNLFGNKELSDSMNIFLNQNWEPIYEDVLPSVNKALQKVFERVAKAYLGKISLSNLFSEL